MGTALTWAKVLAEKQATARIMDVACMFARMMIKTKENVWLRWVLVCNKQSDKTNIRKANYYRSD